MPELTPPLSLRNIAMNVLLRFLASCCHRWSAEGSLDKLRESVAVIKRDISPQIPHHLSAYFHNQLLCKFRCWRSHCSQSHDRAVLEIIMDTKIGGLKCDTPLLFSLNLRDAHRFQGIETLNLSHFCNPLLDTLGQFQLQDLTKFAFMDECTDQDLQIIGQNCPKLEELDVSDSEKVTDVGLRALKPCSKLRIVRVSHCSISINGINDLLLANKSIRQLSGWADSRFEGFDCFDYFNTSVYPSIEYYELESEYISNAALQSLILKFPNLISMSMYGKVMGDINILQNLHKLSHLGLGGVAGISWDNIEQLLKKVGNNLKELCLPNDMGRAMIVTQNCLDLIFEYCCNLELLSFDYRPDLESDKLVVPPFKKLQTFECYIPRRDCIHITTLEFGQMLQLEDIWIAGFHMSTEELETIILDHVNFPKLNFISISGFRNRDDREHLRQIVRDNNIHFHFAG